MDQFPYLIDSDMNFHHDQSTGVGPFFPQPQQDPRVPLSRRNSSLFHYQPLSPRETMPRYAAMEPVQGSHDYIGRPEVSNPPPLHLREVSSSYPIGGHYVHRGQSPMGSTHHSPLHIGTIPLATNAPSTQQPPIGTPMRPNPTQPATRHIPTQGYQPMV